MDGSKLQERSFIAFESKIPSLNYNKDKSSFLKNDSTDDNDFLNKIEKD